MQGTTTTGTWLAGGTSMTVPSTAGIVVGQLVQAPGVPGSAFVTNITGPVVSWTGNLPATIAGTGTPVSFFTLKIVSDMYDGITDLLMGRTVNPAKMAEAVRKTVLEYTQSYKFTELQETGPITQFEANQNNYPPNYFMLPGSALLKANKVNSFFLYTDPYTPPTSTLYEGDNAGYSLTFRTIDRMEVLMNTSGLPLHWTRYNNLLYFGCNPDQSYYTYMRYQPEHPFPNAGTVDAGNDPLFLPDEWQEAVEYGSAARLAPTYNLSGKATELVSRLKGDEKFQRSAGIEGTPGILFGLTSDENRDQSTTVRRFRLRMGSR